MGQMKHILAAEQKKTDFKPEDENNVLIQYTNVSKMRMLVRISALLLLLLTFSLVYLTVL